MTCDDKELPPTTPMAGAERWIRAKVVMKGAEMCDIIVRHETNFPLQAAGCDPDLGTSSVPVVSGIPGVEDIESQRGECGWNEKGLWERKNRVNGISR